MVRFSVDLPKKVAEALARAESELQSTPEGVLAAAARSSLADRGPSEAGSDGFAAFAADRQTFDAWVAEGEADVAAGRVHPLDDVMRGLERTIDRAGARKAT